MSKSQSFEIVGNPKIKHKKRNNAFKIASVGIGLSPLEGEEQINLLVDFIKLLVKNGLDVIVKPHPNNRSQIADIVGLNEVKVLQGDISTTTFFSQIDVICVERSQIGTDSLFAGIPIIVLDLGFSDLQNGILLNKNASVPIVGNTNELILELNKLKLEREYFERRLTNQFKFYDEMFEYVDSEVEPIYHDKLNSLLGIKITD